MKKVNKNQPIKKGEHIRQLEVNAGGVILLFLYSTLLALVLIRYFFAV